MNLLDWYLLLSELCSACWNNDLHSTRTLLQDCDVDFFINNFNARGIGFGFGFGFSFGFGFGFGFGFELGFGFRMNCV
jgi:hypothetical protein